jgi:hypothetical protein
LTKLYAHIGLFLIPLLFILVASCSSDLDKKLNERKLFPLEIIHEVGDDGRIIYNLKISEVGNCFSAKEVKTDNFSSPKPFSYLHIDTLSDIQINRLRTYLKMASALPENCEKETSLDNITRITFEDGEMIISGDCDWKSMDYYKLREYLFNVRE